MSNEITIILADDHPIVRKGLRDTIEEESKIIVLAEVNNGQEAIEAIEKFSPTVTILDVGMPIMNGFDVAREIREKKFPTEIIFMTMHRDEDLFNEAIDLGAKGFVLKDSALSDIVESIKAGNGRKDYLVRIKKGKSAKSMRLVLIAYLSSADGSYQPEKILDDEYSGDLLRSSFSVIKKGTKIQLGEGEGPIVTLKHDAASQYVCETDAVKTLIYEKGKWRNIYDQ